ncbi:MAG: DUF333 domain-containing protein [Anaerolineales bacterium]|nr:DUF333 domain-containing protein [Anaerolineales bacterium]
MFNKLVILVILSLALVFYLVGCSTDEAQTEEPADLPALANPASVYCQGLGYTEETRENDAGQYGVCIFPDGSECDSWEFLAGKCGQENSYCAQQGYTLQTGEGNIGVCIFDDGSTCDEYLYSQGECKPGDNMP